MAKKPQILDPSCYDLDHVVADIEAIRRYNRQRFEMEQLTAIVYEDPVEHVCVGYKDLTEDEFWARGHFPGVPLMPGVVMCESAAQMASYYTKKHELMDAPIVGFGGLKNVHFRDVVRPGERFVVVGRLLKVRRMIMTCQFECLVRENVVCDGILKGIPLSDELLRGTPS